VADIPGSAPPGAPEPQRSWQAPCPNCGAPVPFRSAASGAAVCAYCRSTVVRDGETLKKIGVSAELFGARSALQLGSSGRYQDRGFTLIGRQQLAYGNADPSGLALTEGTWSEWHLLFDDGGSGWLSEDNDQYVIVFAADPQGPFPLAEKLRPAAVVRIAGAAWRVASIVQARPIAAEGELPAPPSLGQQYAIVDLRDEQGRVATLEYADPVQPQLSIGSAVRLADLALQNLRAGFEDAVKKLTAQSFACPSCGAAVELKLKNSRSISCGSCRSLIDVSKGIGAEWVAFEQQQRIVADIPLGAIGWLALPGSKMAAWQVVGFSAKHAHTENISDNFNWQDYLLYNAQEGFAFLIDSEDGWLIYRTLTGTPTLVSDRVVRWNGSRYERTEQYMASVRYVEGEFYWQVQRGQQILTSDYSARGAESWKRLSREENAQEVIWSQGQLVSAKLIRDAFKLAPDRASSLSNDVGPTSDSVQMSHVVILIFVVLFILVLLFSSPDRDNYAGTSGGAYGGYSSGGGHK